MDALLIVIFIIVGTLFLDTAQWAVDRIKYARSQRKATAVHGRGSRTTSRRQEDADRHVGQAA